MSSQKCVKVYNDFASNDPKKKEERSETYITNASAKLFLDELKKGLDEGYGFVPLIGAGFSAPSGAPILREWLPYLGRCIAMSLGIGAEGDLARHWNPRTDQWPQFIDPSQQRSHEFWVGRIRTHLNGLQERAPNSWETENVQQAYGAVAEWRSALQFLARITVSEGTKPDAKPEIALADARQEVIDTGIRQFFEDKHPALNHIMLAIMASALRQNILLTTNFDNLLERAFESQSNPLQVFDVQMTGHLPERSAMDGVRSIVKLHGTRASLRADYSLDVLPSGDDKERFLSYLYGPSGDFSALLRKNRKAKVGTFANHLLVLGFSANDARIRDLIRYAIQVLPAAFKVFWVCYSDKDVKAIRDHQEELCPGNKGQASIHVLRHTDFGLLLLQLYQLIRHTLPPQYSLFPSAAHLCQPTLPSAPPTDTAIGQSIPHQEIDKQVSDALQARIRANFNKIRQLSSSTAVQVIPLLEVVTSQFGVPGVMRSCSKAFQGLETEHMCIWIDMGAVFSTNDLFEAIVEAIYSRLGRQHWTPRNVEHDPKEQAKEIKRIAASTSRDWVIFINARTAPGADSLFSSREDEKASVANQAKRPHGWMDSVEKEGDERRGRKEGKDAETFLDFMLELGTHWHPPTAHDKRPTPAGQPAIPDEYLAGDHYANSVGVVLLNYCLAEGEIPILHQKLDASLMSRSGSHSINCVLKFPSQADTDLQESKLLSHPEKIVTDIVTELDALPDPQDYHKALFRLVLMQRPRYASFFEAEQLCWNDQMRAVTAWLSTRQDLWHYKSGGFVWLHSMVRERLCSDLRKKCQEEEADIQRQLAEWYTHLQHASNSPSAVLEVIYHRCAASIAEVRSVNEEGNSDASTKAVRDLLDATTLLESSRFLLQTQGNPRGNSIRLSQLRAAAKIIRDDLGSKWKDESKKDVSDACDRFELACDEALRALLREIGFEGEAYRHHRACAVLLARVVRNVEDEKLESESTSKYVWRNLLARPRCAEDESDREKGRLAVLRWQKWLSLLAVSSRNYAMARIALNRAVALAILPIATVPEWIETEHVWDPDPDFNYVYAQLRNIKEAVKIKEADKDPNSTHPWRVTLLHLIERSVELDLHRSKLMLRTTPADRYKRMELLGKAHELTDYGLKMAATIRNSDPNGGAMDDTDASLISVRLLEHKAICRARGVDGGQPADGMKILSLAEAMLRVSNPHRYQSELAILEMFRAQVLQIQAGREEINSEAVNGAKDVDTLVVTMEAVETNLKTDTVSDLNDLRNEVKLQLRGLMQDVPGLKKSAAAIRDSMSFLVRAERVLRERRRSVWWTTWYFERNLRCMATAAWLSVYDALEASTSPKGTWEYPPVPFLGPEAAPEHAASAADILFDDAFRMIQFDRYRMATIVSAYISCARAIRVHCLLNQKLNLKHRQQRMLAGLEKTLYELELGIPDRRNAAWKRMTPEPETTDDKKKDDDQVTKYIDEVIASGRAMVTTLSRPI